MPKAYRSTYGQAPRAPGSALRRLRPPLFLCDQTMSTIPQFLNTLEEIGQQQTTEDADRRRIGDSRSQESTA